MTLTVDRPPREATPLRPAREAAEELPPATTTPRFDALAEAIADAAGEPIFERLPESVGDDPGPKTRGLVVICYSGDLEKTWATLILASTAAASGVPTKVFLTFWGLQTFVKDERRITGKNAMQRMLALMQRPGISHRRLSKMHFLGMGPWMMGVLAKQYGVAKPKELLEACQALGVEFMPCQMTMDMFGLTKDDMVEGLGDPVGAASVIDLLNDGASSLFI